MKFENKVQSKMVVGKVMFFLLIFSLIAIFSLSFVAAANHNVLGSTFNNITDTINVSNDNDTILLENKVYTSTGESIKVINKINLVIQGKSDSERAVLDAGHSSRIIVVDENSTVTFRFIDFINGDSGNYAGAAIRAYNTITVDSCSFKNNYGESGAAIFIGAEADNPKITNSIFINNQGKYVGDDDWVEGGAIDSHANYTTIMDCVFISNSALDVGGAVNFGSNTIGNKLTNSNFTNNHAPLGGALRSINNDLLIENCIFDGNYASETSGGALYVRLTELTINGCVFISNRAVSNGGAIYDSGGSSSGYLTITNTIFNNNQATNGGAIYTESLLSVVGSNFTSNRGSAGNVGGIYSSSTKQIENSNFISNSGIAISISGNGVIISANSFIANSEHAVLSNNLQNSMINNNYVASNGGAGLFSKGSNNKIQSNSFLSNGLGIIIEGNNNDISENNIDGNTNQGIYLIGNTNYIGFNNINNNKKNAIYVKGDSITIESNNISKNSVKGSSTVYISGKNVKFQNNNVISNYYRGVEIVGTGASVLNNVFRNNVDIQVRINGNSAKLIGNSITSGTSYGIYLSGNSANIVSNTVNSNGKDGIYLSGNSATIVSNTVSKNGQNGIYVKGNSAKINSNTVNGNGQDGIYIVGNKVKINKNDISYNKGRGLYLEGDQSEVKSNTFIKNVKSAIVGKGNKNIFDSNEMNSNSLKTKACAVYFVGNKNTFKNNRLVSNGYHGLHVVGNSNTVSKNYLDKNKDTHIIVAGKNNVISENKGYNGKGHGLSVSGSNNKVSKNTMNKNKNGIIIKGSSNQLNGNYANTNSKYGVHIDGSKNKLIQNVIRKNSIGIYHKIGNNNVYQHNNIVNKKYNLFLKKGSVDAEYNWWGKNQAYKVKNTKISKYVVAKLTAPNVLKLKKRYNINVKFLDNKNKKLKMFIPSLVVKFSFEGEFSPYVYKVRKNIAKGKIKVSQYGFYTLLAKIDSQNLYKYYIGDSKGKIYELKTYIAMEFKKQGIKANYILVNKVYKDTVKKANVEKNKGEYEQYKSLRAQWLDVVNKMPDGPEKWLMGMVLLNFPKYDFNQYIKAGGLDKILSNFIESGPFGVLFDYYLTGKMQDGLNKNNGDYFKMFGESFLKIYGYSNLKNNDIKFLLNILFGVDENGDISILDAFLNVGLLALSFFTAGTSLLSRVGGSGGKSLLTRIFGKYGYDVYKFYNKLAKSNILTKSWDVLVDASKLLNGNPMPILKRLIPDSFLTRQVEALYTGFKASMGSWQTLLLQTLKYPPIKDYLKGFGTVLTLGLDLNTIYNAYSNIQKISSQINIPSYSTIVNVTNNVKLIVKDSIEAAVKNAVKKEVTKIAIKYTNYYNNGKKLLNDFNKGVNDLGKRIYSASKSFSNKVYGFAKWGLGKIGIKI